MSRQWVERVLSAEHERGAARPGLYRAAGEYVAITETDGGLVFTWYGEVQTFDTGHPAIRVPSEGSKAGAKLSERMVLALSDMKGGAVIQSHPEFAWPKWRDYSDLPSTRWPSTNCPPRRVLQGLHDRGLLDVSSERSAGNWFSVWISVINEAGLRACADNKKAGKSAKANSFSRFQLSYRRVGIDGRRADQLSIEVITARTEREAKTKLDRLLARSQYRAEEVRNIGYTKPDTLNRAALEASNGDLVSKECAP